MNKQSKQIKNRTEICIATGLTSLVCFFIMMILISFKNIVVFDSDDNNDFGIYKMNGEWVQRSKP